jgi:type I restriction enzyme S subunit
VIAAAPSQFTARTIEEVVECLIDYRGKTPPKTGSGVRLITAKVIKGGQILDEPAEFIAADFYDEWMRRGLPQDLDVLITTEAPLGEVALLRLREPVALAQRVILLRANKNIVDPRFLFHALQGEFTQAELRARSSGTTVLGIKQSELRQVRVMLPPLPVQRRIAGILSAYDDLIENCERRIRVLDEMARSLYREWFVDFRFPGHHGHRRVVSPIGDVPEGWAVVPFNNLATITMGLSPKGSTYNDDSDGLPLVNGPVEFGARFTKRMKWTTAPTKTCLEGDLIVCVRGSTTGRFVKSDGVYCLGRGVCAIRGEFQSHVDQLFSHVLPTLLARTGGSTFPSWTGPQLQNHAVLSPPRDLLVRFEGIAGPWAAAVAAYSRQVDNLRATRDLLLPRLLSGQLSVDDAA